MIACKVDEQEIRKLILSTTLSVNVKQKKKMFKF